MSTMHPFTLPELVEQWLPDRGADEALVQGDVSLSYQELWRRSGALAYGLHHLGVRKGDRVVVHMPKSTFEAIATYGISRLGGIVVNVNANVTTRQLRHVLDNSGARHALLHGRAAAGLEAEGVPTSLERVVVIDGNAPDGDLFVRLDAIPDDGDAPRVRLIDRDGCALIYTSGSTGLPKGVYLTHETVVQSARSAATHLRNCREDRALGLLPLSFDFGLSQLMTMALVGGTLVMPRASLPAELLHTINEHDVNALAMVPTMWIPFVRLLQNEGIRMPQVRYVANSGGPLPTDVQRAWPTVFPEARHYLMYGMTEGFRSSYLPPEDFHRKLGSIGVPLPNVELFVVDPERGLCGPNEHGELLHRGNLVSEGYYRNPEATADKIKPCPHLAHLIGDEPVLYSGDTVYRDEDGYLWFVARTTTFIKTSDFRVSPTEVEDVVFSSGLVTDVVAFGRPHETLGQVVEIAVSPCENELDLRGLEEHCRRTMPRYMIPAQIHVWEGEMPRTGNAKVDRPAVISTYLDA